MLEIYNLLAGQCVTNIIPHNPLSTKQQPKPESFVCLFAGKKEIIIESQHGSRKRRENQGLKAGGKMYQ